jgi:hypothetical protein
VIRTLSITLIIIIVLTIGIFIVVDQFTGECDGNITKREAIGNQFKLTIHDKSGWSLSEHCTVQDNAARLNLCDVGDFYPRCAH